MEKNRTRLTYANVMSSLAVFLIVSGGAAFAATQLPKNSVGTKQLKKNAVTGAKVKDRSLAAADFKNGELPTGPTGEFGPRGPTGPSGLSNLHEVLVQKTIPSNSTGVVEAECPPGQVATGGGSANGGKSDAYIYQNSPIPGAVKSGETPVGWSVFYKTGAEEIIAYVYALCATP